MEETIIEVTIWCIDQIDNGVNKDEMLEAIYRNLENPDHDKDFKQILNGALQKLIKTGYVAVT